MDTSLNPLLFFVKTNFSVCYISINKCKSGYGRNGKSEKNLNQINFAIKLIFVERNINRMTSRLVGRSIGFFLQVLHSLLISLSSRVF